MFPRHLAENNLAERHFVNFFTNQKKKLVGQLTFDQMRLQSFIWPNVSCLNVFGQMLVGQIGVGQMSVGQIFSTKRL
jgi:hypothetical protein